MGLEDKSSLNFLCLTISRLNNSLDFIMYGKSTMTDTVIHNSLNESHSTKIAGLCHSLIERLLSIALIRDNFCNGLLTITSVAKVTGISNHSQTV